MESAREATVDDVAAIDEICRRQRGEMVQQRGGDMFLRREVGSASAAERATAALDDEAAFVVVGCYDNVVFGYGLVRIETMVDGARLARLDDFMVDAEAREAGIGEAMMNLILDRATEAGCVGIDSRALPGDRETKNFFESFGLKARMLVVHRSLQ